MGGARGSGMILTLLLGREDDKKYARDRRKKFFVNGEVFVDANFSKKEKIFFFIFFVEKCKIFVNLNFKMLYYHFLI